MSTRRLPDSSHGEVWSLETSLLSCKEFALRIAFYPRYLSSLIFLNGSNPEEFRNHRGFNLCGQVARENEEKACRADATYAWDVEPVAKITLGRS
ncbi:MAG: hypothetical protein ACPGLY_08095 [Rubripirellula sp.]